MAIDEVLESEFVGFLDHHEDVAMSIHLVKVQDADIE